MNTYSVYYWEVAPTKIEAVKASGLTLLAAKKLCRAAGHTDEHNSKWYAPVCYVADQHGFCVYNPRFKYPEEAIS